MDISFAPETAIERPKVTWPGVSQDSGGGSGVSARGHGCAAGSHRQHSIQAGLCAHPDDCNIAGPCQQPRTKRRLTHRIRTIPDQGRKHPFFSPSGLLAAACAGLCSACDRALYAIWFLTCAMTLACVPLAHLYRIHIYERRERWRAQRQRQAYCLSLFLRQLPRPWLARGESAAPAPPACFSRESTHYSSCSYHRCRTRLPGLQRASPRRSAFTA